MEVNRLSAAIPLRLRCSISGEARSGRCDCASGPREDRHVELADEVTKADCVAMDDRYGSFASIHDGPI
jgi:hypothetical protein